MSTYVEISKDAFYRLATVGGEEVTNYKVEETEHARKYYYLSYGVRLLEIDSHISLVTQYFIEDINA